jgi:hypothetical protein
VGLTLWCDFFGLLRNIKILRVQHGIETEVADMLRQDMRIDSTQFNSGFLPLLEEIEVYMKVPGTPISASECAPALEPFDVFVAARREAGRTVNVYRNMDQVLPPSLTHKWPWVGDRH